MISANGTYYPPGTIYTTSKDIEWKYIGSDETNTQFTVEHIRGHGGYRLGEITIFSSWMCSLYKNTCSSIELPKAKFFQSLYNKLK